MLLLSKGNRVEFIQEGFIELLYVTIGPGMLYLSSGVLYPKSVTCLLKFVMWSCFLMPGGILCSTISKDSLSLLGQPSWQDDSLQRLEKPW